LLESGSHTKTSIGKEDKAILPAKRYTLEDLLIAFSKEIHREPLCSL
jgi:hypothetical protein